MYLIGCGTQGRTKGEIRIPENPGSVSCWHPAYIVIFGNTLDNIVSLYYNWSSGVGWGGRWEEGSRARDIRIPMTDSCCRDRSHHNIVIFLI